MGANLLDSFLRKAFVIRRAVLIAFLIGSLSIVGAQLLSARAKPKPISPKAGTIVPNFSFADLAGHQHQLSDFQGRYVLMEFWGTWCQPCVHEIPVLKKARELYQSRGLEILGLDSDTTLVKAQEFVVKHRIPWPEVEPKSTKIIIKNYLKVVWYPALILLNPQHMILFVSGNGRTPLAPNELLKELNRFLPLHDSVNTHTSQTSPSIPASQP